MEQDTQPARVFPQLATDRLLLREFSEEDTPAVFEMLRREDVNEWLETAPLQTIADAEARVRSRMRLFQDGLGLRWAIAFRAEPSQVIGSCGYFSVRRGTASVEAGFELHPDFWRQGIMTEAMEAIIRFALADRDFRPVHRMEALVATGNVASIRLLEKLGFMREGTRREFFYWGGRYQDVHLYALLNRAS